MDTNIEMWAIARNAALRVEFLTNGKEFFLYTNSIYSAMMWGWSKNAEEKIKKSLKKDKLIKR